MARYGNLGVKVTEYIIKMTPLASIRIKQPVLGGTQSYDLPIKVIAVNSPPNLTWYQATIAQGVTTTEMAQRERLAIVSCRRFKEPLMRTSAGRLRLLRIRSDIMNSLGWADNQVMVINRALHVKLPKILGRDAIYDMEDVMAENKWSNIVSHLFVVAARGTGKTRMLISLMAAMIKNLPSTIEYYVTLSKVKAAKVIDEIYQVLMEMIRRDPTCVNARVNTSAGSIEFTHEDRHVELYTSGSFGYVWIYSF